MRLNRFYTTRKNLRVGSSVKLEDTDVKHIRKVLRLGKGDKIILFNGEKEFIAELTLVGTEVTMAKILEISKVEDFSDDKKVELTLFQSLLRAGKFDLIIEKITELGIDNLVPIEAEFSQTKLDAAEKKIERWNKVAIAAAKQSERITILEVLNPIKFQDIEKVISEFDSIFLLTLPRKNIKESTEAVSIKTIDASKSNNKKIAFIIGPEGGFSPKEHSLAKQWGIKFITLNNTVLRSETAAIAVTAIMQFIYNM